MSVAREREREYGTAKEGAEKRVSQLGPAVRDRRRGVTSLSSEMSSLHQVVAQFDVIQEFKNQIGELEAQIQSVLPPDSVSDTSLSPSQSAAFAAAVEKTLEPDSQI